jgi:hypothetical protein
MNTTEAYRALENAAYMEWQDALRSGALDGEVELARDFWRNVVALTGGVNK